MILNQEVFKHSSWNNYPAYVTHPLLSTSAAAADDSVTYLTQCRSGHCWKAGHKVKIVTLWVRSFCSVIFDVRRIIYGSIPARPICVVLYTFMSFVHSCVWQLLLKNKRWDEMSRDYMSDSCAVVTITYQYHCQCCFWPPVLFFYCNMLTGTLK